MIRTEQEEKEWQATVAIVARKLWYFATDTVMSRDAHVPEYYTNRAMSLLALDCLEVRAENQELPHELNNNLRIVRLVKGAGFVRVLPKESHEV